MTTETVGGSLLSMTDDDFFLGPEPPPGDDDEEAPKPPPDDEKPPPKGIVLVGPAIVTLETRSTVPLVLRRVANTKEVAFEPTEDLAVMTAIDVDRNVFSAGKAVEQDDPQPRDPPVFEEGAPLLRVTERHDLDARLTAGVEWRPATMIFTLLLRDKTSNRARVVLQHAPGVFRDEEVEKFLEAKRGEIGGPPEWPRAAVPFPSYQRQEASPPIPDEPGLSLKVERVMLLRGDARPRCLLHGAFRLPVRKEDRVPPLPDFPDDPARPRATVGIHLLVMGSEDPTPLLVPLRAPSWDAIPEGDAPLATGYFAFDLATLVGMGNRPQTFFLYAFSREVMVGPVLTAIVTEDMLPPGAI